MQNCAVVCQELIFGFLGVECKRLCQVCRTWRQIIDNPKWKTKIDYECVSCLGCSKDHAAVPCHEITFLYRDRNCVSISWLRRHHIPAATFWTLTLLQRATVFNWPNNWFRYPCVKGGINCSIQFLKYLLEELPRNKYGRIAPRKNQQDAFDRMFAWFMYLEKDTTMARIMLNHCVPLLFTYAGSLNRHARHMLSSCCTLDSFIFALENVVPKAVMVCVAEFNRKHPDWKRTAIQDVLTICESKLMFEWIHLLRNGFNLEFVSAIYNESNKQNDC